MPGQNTPPTEYPQAVPQEIEPLGRFIAIAHRRRGETQGQWAKRPGVSQPTIARMEGRDPSVNLASYVMCMRLINQADCLADLVSPPSDHAALEREVARVGAWRRRPREAVQARPASKRGVAGLEIAAGLAALLH